MLDLPCFVAGKPLAAAKRTPIYKPGSGRLAGYAGFAQPPDVKAALARLPYGMAALRKLCAWQRRDICERVYRFVLANRKLFAQCICAEAGKPITTANGEVDRAITTFRLAMEESTRINGLQPPADIDERSSNYYAVVERVAAGPCIFITPFNFPLNLVAHKVAPALACGCPFILKPSERTPLTALLLGRGLAESGLPADAWSILPCDKSLTLPMVTDAAVRIVSFTGSVAVGYEIQGHAVGKRTILELGSNSAVVVTPDADLHDAAQRIVPAAFGYAGQSCISVQRIYVHKTIDPQFTALLLQKTRSLRMGNPQLPGTDVGPLIDEASAARLDDWVRAAVEKGARVLIGGKRRGAYFTPTLLTDVPDGCDILEQEAFGPVAVIETYQRMDKLIARINRSRFGLQVGVFSDSVAQTRRLFKAVDAGAVVVNDVPTTRIDSLPYGGVKQSGIGREGVRWAIEDMTELKTLLVRGSNAP